MLMDFWLVSGLGLGGGGFCGVVVVVVFDSFAIADVDG